MGDAHGWIGKLYRDDYFNRVDGGGESEGRRARIDRGGPDARDGRTAADLVSAHGESRRYLPSRHAYVRECAPQNASTMLSDQYDVQAITGDGQAPNVDGLINQLTNPADPADVATFDLFLAAFADQIDGLWASMVSEVLLCTNPDVYKLSAKAFRDIAAADLGSIVQPDAYALAEFKTA